eukprot:gnl/Chilomastix_cuspidata/1058.p1 GENE.gnl/Chilomastix_cuspidata/1058~~gnl/Chilomastix_cuspidata/1058.p1  ORF type:complete len:1053 (+),score=317.02 gnl/Chilomastix_cuspidata/1058:63-3221(+)
MNPSCKILEVNPENTLHVANEFFCKISHQKQRDSQISAGQTRDEEPHVKAPVPNSGIQEPTMKIVLSFFKTENFSRSVPFPIRTLACRIVNSDLRESPALFSTPGDAQEMARLRATLLAGRTPAWSGVTCRGSVPHLFLQLLAEHPHSFVPSAYVPLFAFALRHLGTARALDYFRTLFASVPPEPASRDRAPRAAHDPYARVAQELTEKILSFPGLNRALLKRTVAGARRAFYPAGALPEALDTILFLKLFCLHLVFHGRKNGLSHLHLAGILAPHVLKRRIADTSELEGLEAQLLHEYPPLGAPQRNASSPLFGELPAPPARPPPAHSPRLSDFAPISRPHPPTLCKPLSSSFFSPRLFFNPFLLFLCLMGLTTQCVPLCCAPPPHESVGPAPPRPRAPCGARGGGHNLSGRGAPSEKPIDFSNGIVNIGPADLSRAEAFLRYFKRDAPTSEPRKATQKIFARGLGNDCQWAIDTRLAFSYMSLVFAMCRRLTLPGADVPRHRDPFADAFIRNRRNAQNSPFAVRAETPRLDCALATASALERKMGKLQQQQPIGARTFLPSYYSKALQPMRPPHGELSEMSLDELGTLLAGPLLRTFGPPIDISIFLSKIDSHDVSPEFKEVIASSCRFHPTQIGGRFVEISFATAKQLFRRAAKQFFQYISIAFYHHIHPLSPELALRRIHEFRCLLCLQISVLRTYAAVRIQKVVKGMLSRRLLFRTMPSKHHILRPSSVLFAEKREEPFVAQPIPSRSELTKRTRMIQLDPIVTTRKEHIGDEEIMRISNALRRLNDLHRERIRLGLFPNDSAVFAPGPDAGSEHGWMIAIRKRNLKTVLRKFDNDFEQVYKRRPTHEDKKPLMRFYKMYRDLRRATEQSNHAHYFYSSDDEPSSLRFRTPSAACSTTVSSSKGGSSHSGYAEVAAVPPDAPPATVQRGQPQSVANPELINQLRESWNRVQYFSRFVGSMIETRRPDTLADLRTLKREIQQFLFCFKDSFEKHSHLIQKAKKLGFTFVDMDLEKGWKSETVKKYYALYTHYNKIKSQLTLLGAGQVS